MRVPDLSDMIDEEDERLTNTCKNCGIHKKWHVRILASYSNVYCPRTGGESIVVFQSLLDK